MKKRKNGFACVAMLFALCCLALGLVACGTKTYDITTSINGVVETVTYKEGDEVTIEAGEVDGYKFSYWKFENSSIIENPYTFKVNEETAGTYQAIYEQLETYTVLFYVDGNEAEFINIQEGTTFENALLSSDISTDEICGWFYDEELTQVVSVEDVVTSDITLYSRTATPEHLTFEADSTENPTSYKVVSADLSQTEIVVPATYNGLPVTEVCFVSDEMREEIDATATTITSDETEETEKDTLATEESDGSEDSTEADDSAADGEEVGALSYSGLLESVVLPSTVTTLSNNALYGISTLTSINIPNMVTSLNGRTFAHCSSLESINLPDTITSFGEGYTFYGCTSLTTINSDETGVVDLSNFKITDLPTCFFYNCSSIVKVYLPETIITFSASTTGYGGQFAICSSLVSVNSDIDGVIDLSAFPLTALYKSAFDCHSPYILSMKLPETIVYFGEYAFAYNTSLTTINSDTEGTVDLSKFEITEMSGWLFAGDAIVNIILPETVTTISGWAFENCTLLTSINIPSNITSIGTNAFNGCSSLATVTIESVDVFKAQASSTSNGRLLEYATTVYVLKSIVDDVDEEGNAVNSSAYLQSSSFTVTDGEGEYENYYVFTKA